MLNREVCDLGFARYSTQCRRSDSVPTPEKDMFIVCTAITPLTVHVCEKMGNDGARQ